MPFSRGLWDQKAHQIPRIPSSIVFSTLPTQKKNLKILSLSSAAYLLLVLVLVLLLPLVGFQLAIKQGKKMVLTIILLLVLFLAGLLNIYLYLVPTKKIYAWLQSFFLFKNPKLTTTPHQVLIKERSNLDNNNNNSNKKKDELRSVFATFDKNGDGFITKQELRESLKNIRIFMTEKEVEEMVVKVDSNGDGLIDFDEFCFLCQELRGGGSVEEEEEEREGGGGGDLKEAFDVFDRDKDGLISVEELGLVLSSLGLKEGKRVDACKEMIRKVDLDGDGMVNFDEFKRMMMITSGNSRLIPVF